MYWTLCAILLVGATSASQQFGNREQSLEILQTHPSTVQVEFFYYYTVYWTLQCGGSLLTSRFILSAASCFTGWSYQPRFRRIRAGSIHRETGGMVANVQHRVNHPVFEEPTYAGDISIARTTTPLVFSLVIQPATIAAPEPRIPTNLPLSQPGWGRWNQQVVSRLEIVTAERPNCDRKDGNFSVDLNTSANLLCATFPAGSEQLNYDAGGPWFFRDVTVGVVGGVNNNRVYNGLIAADVTQYTEWIANTVENW